ncbi:hypothetical protein DV738_g4284, partial [Chaetothyriales sp. CBS 135597]
MALNKDGIESVDGDISFRSIVDINGKVEGGSIQTGRKHGYILRRRAIMETFGLHQGVWLPSVERMQEAYNKATQVRDIVHDAETQESFYEGLVSMDIPSSELLTREANKAAGGTTLKSLYFDDILSAEYYRGVVLPDKEKHDFTIPGTPFAQQMHVHLLIRAFNNTLDCEDNAQMIKPFLERRHDPKLVEVLCWTVLKHCIMRSKSDQPLLMAYEPPKARDSPGISTFAQRFDEIVKSLTRSKTICKHLYDSPYIHVFVDDPSRAIRRVNANRDLNRQKGQVMGKGKEVLEQEQKAASRGQTPDSSRRKRRLNATEEPGESPGSGKRTRHGSRMSTRAMGQTHASSSAMAPSTPVGRGSGGYYAGFMVTPTSSVLDTQSSPLARVGLKMEEESPGEMVSPFVSRSAQPWLYTPNLMSPTQGYGGNGTGSSTGYNPVEMYGYANDAYSPYNSYVQGSVSGGLGMNDLQGSMSNSYPPTLSGFPLQDSFPSLPSPMFTHPGRVTSAPPPTTTRMMNVNDLCSGTGILRNTGGTPTPSPLRGFHVPDMRAEINPFGNDVHEEQDNGPASLLTDGDLSGFGGGAEGDGTRFG